MTDFMVIASEKRNQDAELWTDPTCPTGALGPGHGTGAVDKLQFSA
jgi:hypothetical protein